jgi:hypothetical protein
MSSDFAVELVAQNDKILAVVGQELLVGISGIPNTRFRHEVEAGAMDHGGPISLAVGAEEDRGAEDALERSNQSPVLGAALLNTKCIEHFGGAVERDPGGLLSNCHRRQENWNKPILSPWKAIARVTGDLKHETTIPSFMKETSRWRTLYRQPTKDKRPRRESQILRFVFPLLANHLNCVCLSEFPFGDDQLRVLQPQQIARALQT